MLFRKDQMKKLLLVLVLVLAVMYISIFGGETSEDANKALPKEKSNAPDELTGMGYFLDWKKDTYAGTLPKEDEVKKRLTGMSDLDKVIEITKIVGGSRPIYTTSSASGAIAKALATIPDMASPIGDCLMISKRFKDYSKHFGFKTELRTVLHDYLPGHVFNYTISPQGREYIVDIDHSILVEVISDEEVIFHKLPPMVDYFFPKKIYGDSWASSASFFNWVEDIRNNRWRLYLEDVGVKHLREAIEGQIVTKDTLSEMLPTPSRVILAN
jgi:hypothetical protein